MEAIEIFNWCGIALVVILLIVAIILYCYATISDFKRKSDHSKTNGKN